MLSVCEPELNMSGTFLPGQCHPAPGIPSHDIWSTWDPGGDCEDVGVHAKLPGIPNSQSKPKSMHFYEILPCVLKSPLSPVGSHQHKCGWNVGTHTGLSTHLRKLLAGQNCGQQGERQQGMVTDYCWLTPLRNV